MCFDVKNKVDKRGNNFHLCQKLIFEFELSFKVKGMLKHLAKWRKK